MRKAALVINTDKPKAVEAGQALVAWLEARTIHPVLAPTVAERLGRPDLGVPLRRFLALYSDVPRGAPRPAG